MRRWAPRPPVGCLIDPGAQNEHLPEAKLQLLQHLDRCRRAPLPRLLELPIEPLQAARLLARGPSGGNLERFRTSHEQGHRGCEQMHLTPPNQRYSLLVSYPRVCGAHVPLSSKSGALGPLSCAPGSAVARAACPGVGACRGPAACSSIWLTCSRPPIVQIWTPSAQGRLPSGRTCARARRAPCQADPPLPTTTTDRVALPICLAFALACRLKRCENACQARGRRAHPHQAADHHTRKERHETGFGKEHAPKIERRVGPIVTTVLHPPQCRRNGEAR